MQKRLAVGLAIALIGILSGAVLAVLFLPQQRPQRAVLFQGEAASSDAGFLGGNVIFLGGAMGAFDDQSARLSGMFMVYNETNYPENWKTQGTWLSTSLVRFTPFNLIGPNHWSGILVITVDLTLDNGTVVRGETMTIICAMPGSVLPEGVALPYGLPLDNDYVLLTGGPLNYTIPIWGGVMFTAPSATT